MHLLQNELLQAHNILLVLHVQVADGSKSTGPHSFLQVLSSLGNVLGVLQQHLRQPQTISGS